MKKIDWIKNWNWEEEICDCEHDWVYTSYNIAKCKKCKKKIELWTEY